MHVPTLLIPTEEEPPFTKTKENLSHTVTNPLSTVDVGAVLKVTETDTTNQSKSVPMFTMLLESVSPILAAALETTTRTQTHAPTCLESELPARLELSTPETEEEVRLHLHSFPSLESHLLRLDPMCTTLRPSLTVEESTFLTKKGLFSSEEIMVGVK